MAKSSKSEYRRNYYKKNREKLLKKAQEYYQKNIEKMKEYRKNYYKGNKKKNKVWNIKARLKRKMKVFEYYGECKCSICEIDDFEVLTLDHIEGGGVQHRKNLASDGNAIYRWIINNNFPEGFRVLCRNCNWKEHLKSYRKIYGEIK